MSVFGARAASGGPLLRQDDLRACNCSVMGGNALPHRTLYRLPRVGEDEEGVNDEGWMRDEG